MNDEHYASSRSRIVAQALAFFLGVFGAHRFYVGRWQSALLMAITLGGMGIWWLYDNIVIAGGGFRDAEGLLVSNWEPEPGRLPGSSPNNLNAVFDELDQLRADMTDIQDRLDFAERLLADPDQNNSRGA